MRRSGKRLSDEAAKFKQLALDFPVDFVLNLDAFCDALRGAPRAKIIRDAVNEFVERELLKNPGIAERYKEAVHRLRMERFAVVTPISSEPSGEE